MKPVVEFDKAWSRLAEAGVVDVRGGEAYRRLFAEWMGNHQPDEIDEFIRARILIPGQVAK